LQNAKKQVMFFIGPGLRILRTTVPLHATTWWEIFRFWGPFIFAEIC